MTNEEKIKNAEEKIYYYYNKSGIVTDAYKIDGLADIVRQLDIIKHCSIDIGLHKGYNDGFDAGYSKGFDEACHLPNILH